MVDSVLTSAKMDYSAHSILALDAVLCAKHAQTRLINVTHAILRMGSQLLLSYCQTSACVQQTVHLALLRTASISASHVVTPATLAVKMLTSAQAASTRSRASGICISSRGLASKSARG